MEISTEQNKPSWGAQINIIESGRRNARTIPPGCPEWAKPTDEAWHRRGVVVWNNTTQKMKALYASEALEILENLRTTDDWKVKGITFIQRAIYIKSSEEPKRKHPGKKREEPESAPQGSEPIRETVEKEAAHLEPDAAMEFFEWLQAQEATLRRMAEEDKEQNSKILYEIYSLLLLGRHEIEGKEIDISARPLPWVREAERLEWVCNLPPDQGTVQLTENGWFWRGGIKRPDRVMHWSPRFLKLEEAFAWVEQEFVATKFAIQEVQAAKTEVVSPNATISKIDLSPYWIDAAVLESERITYQAIIELEYTPFDFKTIEMSFGEFLRYDERFITPERLARELRMDTAHVIVEQPLGSNNKWYQILSRVIYYQEPVAAAQAQKLWDQSSIVQGYRDGKVVRALYGFREVETGYCVWLGGCEDPNNPWPKPKSRSEYMADCAMGETLIHALDIDGFRARIGFSVQLLSDEKLLSILHTRRAQSIHVPAAARMESEQWLRDRRQKLD